MAAKSRSERSKRPLKKRAAKKRSSGVAARGPRQRASAKLKSSKAASSKRTSAKPASFKPASSKAASSKAASAKAASAKRAAAKRTPSKSAPGMVEVALAAFAHEVRTPLTGILAISDLLATSDLDERERRWVDTIKAGAEHLASLATLFVDAAKTARSGPGVRQDLFDLRALARHSGDSLAGRAAAKGLRSAVDISETLPALVIGDPVRLRAALENLIDNAVKFTEQGEVALAVSAVPAAKGKVGVAFAVSDSGIGLTLAEIKRLFRPFSQANVSIASRFGGAGLGLSSVKQLARAHADGDPGPRQAGEISGRGCGCRCAVRDHPGVAGSRRRGQSVRPRRA
jgi:K+-sensing histidine kinase KdpD